MNDSINPEVNKPVYAGFWLRVGAHILDQLLIGIVSFLIFIPVLIMTGITAGFSRLSDLDNVDMTDEQKFLILGGFMGFIMLMVFISIVATWLYYALMESSSRQGTLGKIALEIKVTDMNGNRITFLNATGRYFGKIITGMTLGIGYLMAGFTTKKQALHDILASCLVVKKQ